ncbi:hypothetical protein SAMN05421854_105245 [Amycolatopsis rubida]|uniref:Uncharacterized protein n=1 Tax=Amycolatopsis rubida TaxID=112413 RepID=A0A1I5Q9Z8_9PSEU|nr:hypothetical protein SAMN05421854_105245 [Amycolatopsis rubida]
MCGRGGRPVPVCGVLSGQPASPGRGDLREKGRLAREGAACAGRGGLRGKGRLAREGAACVGRAACAGKGGLRGEGRPASCLRGGLPVGRWASGLAGAWPSGGGSLVSVRAGSNRYAHSRRFRLPGGALQLTGPPGPAAAAEREKRPPRRQLRGWARSRVQRWRESHEGAPAEEPRRTGQALCHPLLRERSAASSAVPTAPHCVFRAAPRCVRTPPTDPLPAPGLAVKDFVHSGQITPATPPRSLP